MNKVEKEHFKESLIRQIRQEMAQTGSTKALEDRITKLESEHKKLINELSAIKSAIENVSISRKKK
jgi:hypothetical protein